MPIADDHAHAAHLRAFHRLPLMDPMSLRASTPIIGNVERLRRKLVDGDAVTIAAIGSSNVVRGGCPALPRPWRMGDPKCAYPKYTNRSTDDGTPKGWLLQAFEAMQHTWPNAGHQLVNRALMASGPSAFHGCLNRFIPHDADVAILGFADVCNEDALPLHNTTFGLQLEELVRELAARADPPAIVLFNYYKFVSWSCTLELGLCAFWMGCEAQLQELAQFYSASVVSMRNAMYHRGAVQFGGEGPQRSERDFHRWTSDNGGHFDLARGDKYAAEVLFHWMRRVASELPPEVDTTTTSSSGGASGDVNDDSSRAGPSAGKRVAQDSFDGLALPSQRRGRGGDGRRGVTVGPTLPRTFYSTRTCFNAREQRYKPCLYDARHPPASAGTASRGRAWSRDGGPPMSCYTFDDAFGGALSAPEVVSASNWSLVEFERSPHSGERKVKPGYRASRRGATLMLSTRAMGEQEFAIGYLSSARSRAVASLRCVHGCECAPLTVRPGETKVAAGDTTATTDFTPNHAAKAPVDTPCMLELALESEGEPFKLIALHVRSAMVAAVASR